MSLRTYAFTLALATLAAGQPAFAEIYRHLDKEGRVVFTDQPPEDAEPVELGPINTVPGETAPRAARPPVPPPQPVLPYGKLELLGVQPDTVLQNPEGGVSLLARMDIQLQPGHRIVFLHNGQDATTDNSPVFVVPSLERGAHTFTVEIRDANGVPLIKSEPVTIQVHRTSAPPARVRPR